MLVLLVQGLIFFFSLPVSQKKPKKKITWQRVWISGKYDVYVIIIANLIYKTIIGKCVLLHRHAYKVDTTVYFPGGLGRGAEGERIIYFL